MTRLRCRCRRWHGGFYVVYFCCAQCIYNGQHSVTRSVYTLELCSVILVRIWYKYLEEQTYPELCPFFETISSSLYCDIRLIVSDPAAFMKLIESLIIRKSWIQEGEILINNTAAGITDLNWLLILRNRPAPKWEKWKNLMPTRRK